DELIDEGAYSVSASLKLAEFNSTDQVQTVRYASGEAQSDPVGISYTLGREIMGVFDNYLGFTYVEHFDRLAEKSGLVFQYAASGGTPSPVASTHTALSPMGDDAFAVLSLSFNHGLVPGLMLHSDEALSYYSNFYGFSGTSGTNVPIINVATSAVAD